MSCQSSTVPFESTTIKASDSVDENRKIVIDQEVIDSLWSFSEKTIDLINQSENNIYSPASLYSALSMLIPASKDDTLKNLMEGLELNDSTKLTNFFKKFNLMSKDFSSLLTNSVWLSEKDEFDVDTLKRLSDEFLSSAHVVNFENKEETKQKIEAFINEQTKGFIKDLDVNVNEETNLVLLNTLYFKDRWINEMIKDDPIDFNLETGETIKVDASRIYMDPAFDYKKTDSSESVSQFFENGYRMMFVKPVGSLSDYIKDIEFDILKEQALLTYESAPRDVDVILRMPHVDISSSLDAIENVLLAAGFDDVLEAEPNISFMKNGQKQFVNDIIQQARIKVDEKGAEAAAFTMVEMAPTSAEPIEREKIEFTLDKPYLMILLSPEGIPLFISTVFNPSES